MNEVISITRYSHEHSRAITDLFYQAVHHIDENIYDKQQKQAWAPYPINYQQWAKRFDTSQPWLLFKQQQIAAFIEFNHDGYIDCLYVLPKYQHNGLATLLIKHILQQAKRAHIGKITVNASVIAKPLFKQLGFICEKENHIIRHGITLNNYAMTLTL